jgi:hypothetical protein
MVSRVAHTISVSLMLVPFGVAGCNGTAEPTAAPAVPQAVGFGSYGPLRVGMSHAEVLAATPVALSPYGSGTAACTYLVDSRMVSANPYGELQVTLDRNDRLVGISPPANARTDRGVGVGSTRDQVVAAYPEPVHEGENEAGPYLAFTGPSGASIGFNLDAAGTVVDIRSGTPEYSFGYEICSGG